MSCRLGIGPFSGQSLINASELVRGTEGLNNSFQTFSLSRDEKVFAVSRIQLFVLFPPGGEVKSVLVFCAEKR